MPSTQRFDALLSEAGTLAALRGSDPRLDVDMVDDTVVVAHVPRAEYEASILGLGVSAMEAILERGNRLVVGSGFVSVLNPVSPLGLLQLDGKIESELTPHGYTRILGVRTAGLAVVGRSDYHPGMFEAAVQVGPGIIQSASSTSCSGSATCRPTSAPSSPPARTAGWRGSPSNPRTSTTSVSSCSGISRPKC